MWADGTLTVDYDSFSSHGTSYSDKSWSATTSTSNSISGSATVCFDDGENYVKIKNGHPAFRNTTALPGAIKSIYAIRQSNGSNRNLNIYVGTEALTNSNYTSKGTSLGTITVDTDGETKNLTAAQISAGYKYFYIYGGSNVLYLDEIVITFETGYTITFKETGGSNNGSGSAAANATSMTISTAPTPATGKMVEGYYAENTLTTKVANANGSWAADNITGWVTSGKYTKGSAANLYIKWTDLVTTVTLDKGTDGTTNGTATITYNATSFTSITDATKTGYHLNGYYTLATGGSKVINADGSLVSSLSGWTSSGKWVKNATTATLYAQWTIDTYTIHWKVNGNDWEGSTHGSPSTSANYNTKPSTIPTAPASSDCDNSKVFVGWTVTPIAGTTNTFPSDLFYTKEAAPNITGNTTFYAVFATGGVATFNSSTLSGLTEDDTYWSWTHDASGTVFDLYGDYSSRSNNIWVIGYGSSGTYGEITAPASSYLANVAITLSAASNKVVSVTQGTLTTNSTAQNVVFRSAQSSTQLKPATSSTQTKITNMVITYVSSTPAFATSCCTSLASINGSFF